MCPYIELPLLGNQQMTKILYFYPKFSLKNLPENTIQLYLIKIAKWFNLVMPTSHIVVVSQIVQYLNSSTTVLKKDDAKIAIKSQRKMDGWSNDYLLKLIRN